MVFFGFGEAFRSGTHKAMIMAYLDKKDIKDSKSKVYGKTRSFSLGLTLIVKFSIRLHDKKPITQKMYNADFLIRYFIYFFLYFVQYYLKSFI